MPVTAIYARASKDRDDRRISTDRQLERCRKLAADLFPALPVREFVDNNLSGANPDVTRPAYDALVAAIRRGEVSEVVAHEQSRLTRQPGQWDDLVITLGRAGIDKIHTVQQGPVAVGSGNRLLGRIMAAVDAEETERAKARFMAMHEQLAADGRPSGRRPYGYDRTMGSDGRAELVINQHEAKVIRLIAERILAGHSARAVLDELHAQFIPAPRGPRWSHTGLVSAVTKPTVAGLRAHRGQVVGKARWEAILPPERWERVVRALGSETVIDTRGRTRKAGRIRTRSPRKWLLTGGLAVCGKCGAPMAAGPRRQRVDGTHSPGAYRCSSLDCGHVQLGPADAVEEHVVGLVLDYLDDPKMASRLTAAPDTERSPLIAELAEVDAVIARVADELGTGAVDYDTFTRIHGPAKARADALRSRLADLSDPEVDLPEASVVREQWETMPLGQHRAVLDRVVERVVIHPRVVGSKRSVIAAERVAERVELVWRKGR
jgi:site-specific DNA recombinase